MNFKVIPTPTFAKSLKALAKRHKSMKADMDAFRKSLEEDPFQGTELTPGVRKIRMAITSKGGGKSGGARVITYNVLTTEQDGKVYLMEIYDKSDAQTVKLNVIKEWIKELQTCFLSVLKRFGGFGGEIPHERQEKALEGLKKAVLMFFYAYSGLQPVFFKGSQSYTG